ncbi:hypothetical protein ACM46_04395 [Chryseobacterium angstadtii]|uniref:3-keto-disaccharide hydrolase domain-containing protein n=1 Tax=Chryseobacterium angstadtii TaxID=558151 RepID=A0A0J7LCW0_9FLAO|nr:hypothetical protein [Chryseobacterium angstadtii]KMQ66750.1 hypothetical protein ACM46_04395 [Chryseobacterium angstadtii]
MISKRLLTTLMLSVFAVVLPKAQKISLKSTDVIPSQVTAKEGNYKGKNALVLEIQGEVTNEKTLALIKNIDFHNGTIEATISGQTNSTASETARGFVGIAFRVAGDISKMEVFYLRPTNGRANDQVRRNHSTQYISWPGYPWEKLRKETPEKYEAYADMVPGEWIKVKIEVKGETAKLYVNGASQPTLIVNDLKQGGKLRGGIGLWIGPGTLGHFTDLKIMKED